MRVFHIATECSGIVSDGGVGDVVLQIAKQSALAGFETTLIVPLWGKLDDEFEKRYRSNLDDAHGGSPVKVPLIFPGKAAPSDGEESVRFIEVNYAVGTSTIRLCFIDAERFRRRLRPYGRPDAYPDVYPINLLLQKAALLYIHRLLGDTSTSEVIIHGHDAHVGTLPFIARATPFLNRQLADCVFVVTAHNCGWGYRQRLWMKDVERERRFLAAALDASETDVMACVFDDGNPPMPGFEPFAAAALFGDYLTIVSEGYCWEIVQGGKSSTAECDGELRAFAAFLDGRKRTGSGSPLRAKIRGITNGTDPAEVGVEALPLEVKPKGVVVGEFAWKREFKADFLLRLRGDRSRPPYWNQIGRVTGSLNALTESSCLFTYVGRLDQQKGLDILAQAVTEVFTFDDSAGLCLLGGGELPELQALAERFPGRCVILDGRSENVAKEIYAAGDFFLLPSRFEPCGLTDFRAQLSGNIPIANQVGGLSKIVNGKTGLGFFGLGDRSILRGLVDNMLRGIALFGDPEALMKIQTTADQHVRHRHTWATVFPEFLNIYKEGQRV